MKKQIGISILFAGLIFLGCKGSISLYTYTNDLIDVANRTEDSLLVNANIIVEGLKEEEDIAFLRNNLEVFSNEKIVLINYTESLSFETKFKIIQDNEISELSENDLIFIKAKEFDDRYEYKVVYNYKLLNKIKKYVSEKYYNDIDFKEFDISITIDNDLRSIARIIAYSVYVNFKPYPLVYIKDLPRREKVILKLSEILQNDISMNETVYPLFIIKKNTD